MPRGLWYARGMYRWLHQPMSGVRYLIAGLLLAALKTSIDFAIARAYGHAFSVLFYVSPVDAPLFHMRDDHAYWEALAVNAIPFVAVGLALTVKRLRDAALSPWFSLLFFVPFANLLFFASLVLLPSRPAPRSVLLPHDAPYREPRPLPPILVPMQRYPRLTAAVFGSVIGLGTMAVSVGLLKTYGVALMLGAPMISGFATGAFYARLDPDGHFRDALVSMIFVIMLTIAGVVILGIEGLGCLFMFTPLLVAPGLVGALIGFTAARALPPPRVDFLVAMTLSSFFVLLAVERVNPLPPLHPRPVETSVEIDAPVDRVWALLPRMEPMPPPTDWVFRYAGIAYPERATLAGEGVGARRTCEFTTGAALETVDLWSPGRALGFTIDAQPDPMRELTLYRTVRQPHLDGSVRNRRGELTLTELPGGRTRLTGRSWYEVQIAPESYWRLWSDLFIHKIHERVLAVVKARAEAATPGLVAARTPAASVAASPMSSESSGLLVLPRRDLPFDDLRLAQVPRDDVGDEPAGVRLRPGVLDDVDDGLHRGFDRLRSRELAVVHDSDAQRVHAELGRDDARQEERHLDAGMCRPELDAQRRRQHVHRALDRTVGGPDGRERGPREAARDVDDLARILRLEVRQDGLDAVDDALHVDGPHGVEVLVGQVGDAARDAATRVVHPDVDPAEAVDGRPGQVVDVAPLRDVGDHRERVLAEPLRDRVELVLATRPEDDLGPSGRELLRELRPDPGARTRDDDDLVHAGNVGQELVFEKHTDARGLR